jgi:hypothetical protein
VENTDFVDKEFDPITLLDIFEHLQGPNAELQAI